MYHQMDCREGKCRLITRWMGCDDFVGLSPDGCVWRNFLGLSPDGLEGMDLLTYRQMD